MIETILPAQYSRRSPLHGVEPHKKLMAAVLQTVVDDRRGGSLHKRSRGDGVPDGRRVSKAIAYLVSTDRSWPFSFENLCEALGLDANGVRDGLAVRRALARSARTAGVASAGSRCRAVR